MRGQGKNSPRRARASVWKLRRKSSLTSKAAGRIVSRVPKVLPTGGPRSRALASLYKDNTRGRSSQSERAPRSRTEIPFHAKEVRADVVSTVGSRWLVWYSLSGLVEEPAPPA